MGICKLLNSGKLSLNKSLKCIEITHEKVIAIPYSDIKPTDWGFIYEKYVGQTLEAEQYVVFYEGLSKGFLDRGVDIIAENEKEKLFIQCKFKKGRISKNDLEWILYKASKILLEEYSKSSKKISFVLVINNTQANFAKRISKNDCIYKKIEYPLLQHFLNYNNKQDKVRVCVREITMINSEV